MLQYTIFLILAPLAAIITAGVILYAWRSHTSRETTALVWLLVAIVGWLTCNLFELIAVTEASTIFWAKAGYFFIISTVIGWFVFALRYTGKEKWLTPARVALVCAVPLITILLVWTNEVHTLVWRRCTFIPIARYLALRVDHGPWFWVNISYTYMLVFIGAFLIVKQSFTSYNLYRQQSIWLTLGAITPIVANAIYVFRLVPNLNYDYTSVSFAIAGLAFAAGMLRHRLFDLQPIAREAVIDSMNDAVFALDTQDRVIDLNPAAQRLLDLPAEAILGQPGQQILNRWQTFVEQFQDTMNIQTDITIDHDGTPRTYDLRISSLADRRGKANGRLIILRDITARKQAEVALRERTAELETRNEQLKAFAHTVAHDIKDPLTAIVGYSGMLHEFSDNLTPEEQAHYLETIINTSTKLASVVDTLLLLASVHQIEERDVYPLDMYPILEDVLGRLSHLIQEYRAEVIVPDTWPIVKSYGPWIEEVWVNYVSNAIKYGGNADIGVPPRVELGFDEPDTRQDAVMRFWVKDNGPGLTPEQQSQLFTQFRQLHGASGRGHGLGLSIVHDIVEKLGGEVGVECNVGQGSTFWFTIPVAFNKERELKDGSQKTTG